ncbi:MAG TPA: hypothetical protein VFG46_28585 [Chryseolinea sp.]|nr:hypothetical protein [Chryseolinea sp.]
MRYKISISAPAILSIAVFVFGLFVILLYSLEVKNRVMGSEFRISISLQTFSLYLVSSFLCSLSIFVLLKGKRE